MVRTAAANVLPGHQRPVRLGVPRHVGDAQQMGMWTFDETEYGSQTYAGYTYQGDPWHSPASNMTVLFPSMDDVVGPQGVTLIGGQPTGQYEAPASDLSVQAWDGLGRSSRGRLKRRLFVWRRGSRRPSAWRRQPGRPRGHQRSDDRASQLWQNRHDLVPGRVYRRRHGGHQRPDHRAGQL